MEATSTSSGHHCGEKEKGCLTNSVHTNKTVNLRLEDGACIAVDVDEKSSHSSGMDKSRDKATVTIGTCYWLFIVC